jgi:hypothetical protein
MISLSHTWARDFGRLARAKAVSLMLHSHYLYDTTLCHPRRRWWTIGCVLGVTGALGSRVTRLMNGRSTRARGDELIVENLLEEWPRDAADLDSLRERVFADPLYVDSLVSRDGS